MVVQRPSTLVASAETEFSHAAREVNSRPTDKELGRMPMEVDRMRLLLRELDLAAAMLELARIAHDFETRRRNYRHARQSYEAATNLLPSLTLSSEQRQDISSRLAELQDWLDVMGDFKN